MEIQAPGAGSSGLTRLALIAVLLCAALLAAGCGRESAGDGARDTATEPEEVVLTPEAAREGRKRHREQPKAPNSKAQVVELLGAGSAQSIEVDPDR